MTTKEIREETTNVRIYGRTLTKWLGNRETGDRVRVELSEKGWTRAEAIRWAGWETLQTEIEYTTYRLDGTVCGYGSRDFAQFGRWFTKSYDLKTWDGVKRWKNGAKSCDYHGRIMTDQETRRADLIRVLKIIDPRCRDAAEVRLEK